MNDNISPIFLTLINRAIEEDLELTVHFEYNGDVMLSGKAIAHDGTALLLEYSRPSEDKVGIFHMGIQICNLLSVMIKVDGVDLSLEQDDEPTGYN